MKIYIGSYWVDFPMSEYGGMWAVVAKDEEDLFEVLKESQSGFFGDELDDDIRQAIKDAKSYRLDSGTGPDYCTPHVVKFFYT
jgi:hypothetical protein